MAKRSDLTTIDGVTLESGQFVTLYSLHGNALTGRVSHFGSERGWQLGTEPADGPHIQDLYFRRLEALKAQLRYLRGEVAELECQIADERAKEPTNG